MSMCKFDTFENDVEMNQMIKKFQEKTREYLQFQENLDSMTCPIKES